MRKGKTKIGRDSQTGQFVLGREAFGKVSAVEGLSMPKTMQRDFRALDKQGASPRARREVLSDKYGK